MDSDTQTKADERFKNALEHTGARDPRELYRSMLRELKTRDADEYEAAVDAYRISVLAAIAEEGADPLGSWLEFGRKLAGWLHPGRTVVIDATGKALAFQPPARWDRLTLHLPENRRENAVAIGLPPELTRAQRATVNLLAQRKVRLPED